MIRLLLADDHAIVREGLKQLFALTEDIVVQGEACNGGEVLELLRTGQFDLVLLDMNMPGFDGAELIARIRARAPELPILVLTMHNEPQAVRKALRTGATGYVTKDVHPELLLSALRKVATGARFIEPALAEKVALDVQAASEKQPHERLSDREFHILRLLAKGMTINEIAAELTISNNTVSTHKARLMQKMNIENNADLVRYAITHGLVD